MANQRGSKRGHGFGTAPVFFAAINTILGAILFLRFGYAVGNVGIGGSLLIIFIGHAITIPTALALAEIATNLKVEGGGEYFIISRSFGSLIGGTIGLSLYAAQAISISFYMIAFSQAFTPLFQWIHDLTGIIPDARMISIPATILLLYVILKKGANIGVKSLYVVSSILILSLVMFFLGNPITEGINPGLFSTIDYSDDFFKVFAIVFPAFTGMTAGVGLSGDLKNPRKAIPFGTLGATSVGMLVYVMVAFKLGMSASAQDLAFDQLIMSKIALWGPIIPIGLAAATLSSAIGSILIAPRTMQALANDGIFPSKKVNEYLKQGRGNVNEPYNAIFVTSIFVLFFVMMGSVNFVAQVISMFFMITYGALCLVSFLEHFAGNISYRPTFKTKWYFSLIGALACFFMMFQMSGFYATIALITMVILYISIKQGHQEEQGFSSMLRGVLFQLTRKLQVLIQQRNPENTKTGWRPSFVAISSNSFNRLGLFDLLRWLSHYQGFGTYIHYVQDDLNETTKCEAKKCLEDLITLSSESQASIYVDTIISPEFKQAVEHIIQMPGISGMENNIVLLDYDEKRKTGIEELVDATNISSMMDYNICILKHSERHFGYKRKIHIWLRPIDFRNANLMILLSYILMSHPEWKNSDIQIFSAFHENEMEDQVNKLNDLIEKGQIPISQKNIQKIPFNKEDKKFESLVKDLSSDADLIIVGFTIKRLSDEKKTFFRRYKNNQDMLFVYAGEQIVISAPSEEYIQNTC